VVGDVMMDANQQLLPVAWERSTILDRLGLERGGYVVVTLHREANVVEPRLGRILEGLSRIDKTVVFPAHPRTAHSVRSEGLSLGHVQMVQPLGYLDFAALASRARVIVTDSGGLQKEAYWYGIPCVTARANTEWVDTVETGANVLVDDDPDRLADAVRRAEMPRHRPKLYGDGHAAERIAAALYPSRPE
jgi:UDP-N-acetylglucosamine 2-epimerase